jgi:hypothetical protein
MCTVFLRKYGQRRSQNIRIQVQTRSFVVLVVFSVFAFEISSLRSSNRCAHLCESHRNLRDGSFGVGAVPGTSCQAAIAPFFRDISQQALTSSSFGIDIGRTRAHHELNSQSATPTRRHRHADRRPAERRHANTPLPGLDPFRTPI